MAPSLPALERLWWYVEKGTAGATPAFLPLQPLSWLVVSRRLEGRCRRPVCENQHRGDMRPPCQRAGCTHHTCTCRLFCTKPNSHSWKVCVETQAGQAAVAVAVAVIVPRQSAICPLDPNGRGGGGWCLDKQAVTGPASHRAQLSRPSRPSPPSPTATLPPQPPTVQKQQSTSLCPNGCTCPALLAATRFRRRCSGC